MSKFNVLRLRLQIAEVEIENIGWVKDHERHDLLGVVDEDDWGTVLRIAEGQDDESPAQPAEATRVERMDAK